MPGPAVAFTPVPRIPDRTAAPAPTTPAEQRREPEPCEPAEDPDRSTGHETSAAAIHGWGAPVRAEEFDAPLGAEWTVYDGPGHARNGRRTPDAVTIEGGIMTITGEVQESYLYVDWVKQYSLDSGEDDTLDDVAEESGRGFGLVEKWWSSTR